LQKAIAPFVAQPRLTWVRLLVMVAMTVWSPPALGQHQHTSTAAQVGLVRFPTSCRGAVTEMFDRGVSLLHASWTTASMELFRLVGHSDADCAMAWWGIALSNWGGGEEGVAPRTALHRRRWRAV
jgi:hypothetical protein